MQKELVTYIATFHESNCYCYQIPERLHSLNDSTSAILVLLGQRVADFLFIKEKNTLKTIKISGFRAEK